MLKENSAPRKEKKNERGTPGALRPGVIAQVAKFLTALVLDGGQIPSAREKVAGVPPDLQKVLNYPLHLEEEGGGCPTLVKHYGAGKHPKTSTTPTHRVRLYDYPK